MAESTGRRESRSSHTTRAKNKDGREIQDSLRVLFCIDDIPLIAMTSIYTYTPQSFDSLKPPPIKEPFDLSGESFRCTNIC